MISPVHEQVEKMLDIVIEDIDNALMNDSEAEKFINEGGKITIIIDKEGTTVKTRGIK